MGLGFDIAKTTADLARGAADLRQGVAVGQDWINGLVIVNVDGGRIPMPFQGPMPVVGFRVWVTYLGPTRPICVGQIEGPASGIVEVAAAAGRVQVRADDGKLYPLGFLGTAPTVGQRVLIDWSKGGLVQAGAVSVLPGETLPVEPPRPAPSRVEREFVFNASDSRNNYQGSWSSHAGNEVWCSDNNRGCYFYGNSIPDSIPDDAEFVSGSLRIYLAEFFNQYPSSLARLGQHNLSGPNGGLSLGGIITVSAGTDWKGLPDSWEGAFRTGGARGVGFENGGYHKFRPAGVENSGTIVGKWRVWQ